MASNRVLTPKYPSDPGCIDFILNRRATWTWIEIPNPNEGREPIVLYIFTSNEGVIVDLYPNTEVMDDPAAQARIEFEGQEDSE